MAHADLHIHTIFSYDGTASVPAVLERARQVGLDVIAITDHDEIRSALLAEELAHNFGVQVIPGVEITTADGDLLALSIRKLVPAGLTLIETVIKVGELGGFCIAPHPMAGGWALKSLSAHSIYQALRDDDAARVLIGMETYNATALDRQSRLEAKIWAERLNISQTGSSDAHLLEAIGLGRTIDLVAALWMGTTLVQKGPVWGSVQTLGKWAISYLKSTPARLTPAFNHQPYVAEPSVLVNR
jgi:predicted metal-dependent phosphoesterase TrpH